MKLYFVGPIFHPTGIATANREIVKELIKQGNKVQCSDPFNSKYEFSKGLESLNNPIDMKECDYTIFSTYPAEWTHSYGKTLGIPIHEGTKLPPGWTQTINKVDKICVAANSVRNLLKWNGVTKPISVTNYGVSELYIPKEINKKDKDPYLFLSVNSWTGEVGDRKGTDLLIKAFNEEFTEKDNVKLLLKISTFWMSLNKEKVYQTIFNLCDGKLNENILIDFEYRPEKEIVEFYQKSDCFVAPTRGEGFGLTILNAKACGLPVIVTKDDNSGHMDFCKDDSTLWIDAPKMAQADPRFFVKGNMQPIPELESLKKQLRFAYDNQSSLRKKALENSSKIRENFSWKNTAKKIIEVLNENS